jgi:hypothetical protein
VQARLLARELSECTKVRVDLEHQSGRDWLVEWGDGPTWPQMRDLVQGLLAERYPLLRDRQLDYHRGQTARAWAARAVAAWRDGTLATEVTAYAAAFRQRHPDGLPWTTTVPLTAEDHAVLHHVEILLNDASYPDRADADGHEPVIARLLELGGRQEHRMARIMARVLGGEEDLLAELPPGVTRLRPRMPGAEAGSARTEQR